VEAALGVVVFSSGRCYRSPVLRHAPLILVIVSLFFSSAAAAQAGRRAPGSQQAAARAAFEEGSEHYEHGRYREAMDAFERAYAAMRSPEFLYNIYTAAQRAGELPRAEEALSGYLESHVVPQDERPALEARLVLLRQEIADAEAARLAAEEQARVAAAAEAAEAQRLAEAERRAREAEEEAARGAPRVSSGATVGFVVGAGGLASFATFAALAAREDRRVGRSCGAEVGEFCTESDVRQLRAYSATADVSLVIGGVGAATGLIVFFIQRRKRADILERSNDSDEAAEPGATVQVAPLIGGPAGAWGLAAGGTF
jgi:tetratricopeptide (TPR) repeat protein